MRTAKVKLGGKEFEIQELKSRANAAWRKKLEEPFTELALLLKRAPNVSLGLTDGESEQEEEDAGSGEAEQAEPLTLSSLIESLSGLLLGSLDTVIHLLLEYAPQLEEAREEAYDSEFVAAFTAVLGLAYPFGNLLSVVGKLTNKKQKPGSK